MTKKDFELLARVLRRAQQGTTNHTNAPIVLDLADELARAYPNFKRSVFVKAAGCAHLVP